MDTQDWAGLTLVVTGGAVAAENGALVGAALLGVGILVVFVNDSDG